MRLAQQRFVKPLDINTHIRDVAVTILHILKYTYGADVSCYENRSNSESLFF